MHKSRREFLEHTGKLLAGAATACGVSHRPTTIRPIAWDRTIEGQVFRPGERGYERARAIWNQSLEDRRPAFVVRPGSVKDVARSVRFAAEHGLPLAIRGGGHNHLGFAVCDGGVMLDLSSLKATQLRPDRRTASVQPGLTFADYDRLTHRAGLASTGAIVSQVGLPGYLLGGGLGWLQRKTGAGCDNVLGVQVVTAAGEILEANEHQNADLFWAVRGGGGNFGVVTRFDMRLHEISTVHAGLLFFPLEDAWSVSRFVDGYMDDAPRELNVWMFHRRAPASPLVPVEIQGRPVLILAVTFAGADADAERVVSPLRRYRAPLLDLVQRRTYLEWQTALDGSWGDGFCNEWVGHYLDRYDDAAIRTLIDFVSGVPSLHTDVKLARMGGAISDAAGGETAFGFRKSRYALVIQSRWREVEQTRAQLAWTTRFHRAMAAHANGKVYSNFIGREPASRTRDAFEEASLSRLRRIKQHYDPGNMFCRNINIEPLASSSAVL